MTVRWKWATMLKFGIILVGAASIVAGAASASEESALREAAATLKSQPTSVAAEEDQAKARSSIAWGNIFSGANLMERANAGHTTVLSRFNLASAYERTGRLREASDLYRGLVRDGQYTTAILDPRYDEPGLAQRSVNVADESASRLAVLDRLAQSRMASVDLPFSAAQAASNVAAVEGASPTGRLSDDRALQLDAMAAANRRAVGAP
jgi:hypothetical protein